MPICSLGRVGRENALLVHSRLRFVYVRSHSQPTFFAPKYDLMGKFLIFVSEPLVVMGEDCQAQAG